MSDKFAGLPDIATIQPDRLIKARVSEDRFAAEVLLPGLWYTDFDKKIGGKWSLWSIAKFTEGIRWQCLKSGFGYYQELIHGQEHLLFIASVGYNLTEKCHKVRYDNHFGKTFPLRADAQMSSVGRTSFTMYLRLSTHSTNELIMSLATKVVYINKNTRKPSPLPVWLKERYQRSGTPDPGKDISRFSLPDVPYFATMFQYKALASDCDMNEHVTQSVYMRWCSDSVSHAAKMGRLAHVSKHLERYPMKSISIQYQSEALMNDTVTCVVWEDAIDNKRLYCVIRLDDRDLVSVILQLNEGPAINVLSHLESKL